MSNHNTAYATITVHDDATPSQHYTADELAGNGAMDYSITVSMGGGPAIECSITLYRDHDGSMTPCGAPMDGWVGPSLIKWIRCRSEADAREILIALSSGPGVYRVEICDADKAPSAARAEVNLVRESSTARDGWPTSDWLRDLSRHVEAIGYAMDPGDLRRNRVMSIAAALLSGSTARDVYPTGVSISVDIERRRSLDSATQAADGIIIMLPTIDYDLDRAAQYRSGRGW